MCPCCGHKVRRRPRTRAAEARSSSSPRAGWECLISSGGCSRRGVDCSCLVLNVYAALGIHLPRVAVDQFDATQPISDLQPGDLVFFANTCEPGISHVGIYIGNGLQINAPTTGQVVSVAPVFTGYWGAHYAAARRVPT
ncbi:MAG: C40 family peptidase [Chloroflexi bacterium]|nr:C40 family peptidase [Chloroflexota bacterium]